MTRELNEGRIGKKPTGAPKSPITLISCQESQLELKSRLGIEEDNARWQRRKDMILVGTFSYVVLGSFTIWVVVLLPGAYSSTDKQLITGFIVQLLFNLFFIVTGKRIKWKE